MNSSRALQRNKRTEVYATASAAGTATAVASVPPGPSWDIKQNAVTVTGSTLIPTASTYIGTNSAGVFVSSTLTGDSDTDSFPTATLRSGESMCAVWAGCTPGALCKFTVIYDEVAY